MSRIVKPPDIRKQELINIALKQFLEKGYERTSVRSILKEANGEIGMFYHYFESKSEIYEAALEKYNKKYIKIRFYLLKKNWIVFLKDCQNLF